MDETELLKDLHIPTEEESRVKKALKKTYTRVIALFLLFLFLTILLLGYNIMGILEGKVASDTLSDAYALEFSGGQIIMEPAAYHALRDHYVTHQEAENKFCLLGRKEGTTYYVTGHYLPEVHDASVFHVHAEQCNEDTIISLHTHPEQRCILSAQDIRSYDAFAAINPDGIVGVMCAVNRFAFYNGEQQTLNSNEQQEEP